MLLRDMWCVRNDVRIPVISDDAKIASGAANWTVASMHPVITGCSISLNDDVVSLTNGNVERRSVVRLNWYKVWWDDREWVVVDPESHMSRGSSIDKRHLVCLAFFKVELRELGTTNASRCHVRGVALATAVERSVAVHQHWVWWRRTSQILKLNLRESILVEPVRRWKSAQISCGVDVDPIKTLLEVVLV